MTDMLISQSKVRTLSMHMFKKITQCKVTGRKLKRPEYLYRGFKFKSEPWKNSYGHWNAIKVSKNGNCWKFNRNTRKDVKYDVDCLLDGTSIV